MADYDVFEVNPTLSNYVFALKKFFDGGKKITSEKRDGMQAFLKVIYYEAIVLNPRSIDDVKYLMYSWKNEGVNKKTDKFIMNVIAELDKLNDDVK